MLKTWDKRDNSFLIEFSVFLLKMSFEVHKYIFFKLRLNLKDKHDWIAILSLS